MNLKEKRLIKGMTQVELAQKIGSTQSSITRFETGIIKPKPATAKKIAAVLGFDWTEFYEEEPNGEAETSAAQS